MARFVKLRQSHHTIKQDVSGTNIPTGSTSDRSSAPTAGEFRFNTDVNALEVFNGTNFQLINNQGVANITTDSFVGDGSTTEFTLSTSITNDQTQRILVAVGNVFQNPSSAYTLSGTTITFTSPPPSAETIVVIHGFDSNLAQ